MQHEQRRALTFVEIVHQGAIDVVPVALEGVLVLEEPVGSIHGENGSAPARLQLSPSDEFPHFGCTD